jgi:N-acetylglucosamine-6-phosphate deacetylase
VGSPNSAEMSKFAIINAKVILPDKVISPGTVVVEQKKIVAIRRGKSAPRGSIIVNARGNFVAPGFIDLHIHGDVKDISIQQAKGGTTGFLATLHPAAQKVLLQNIKETLAQKKKTLGAKVLGIRLEGPFLNRDFCGALPSSVLREPHISEAKSILKQSGKDLKMVVVAPELKGASTLIRLLKKHNVLASVGHSGATCRQVEKGIVAGITCATHTFNRMRAFDHRAPGALGAVLTDERISCEVIADGIHVHPVALKVLLLCKGPERIMLITDSTAAQRRPPKRRCGDVFRLKSGVLYGTALTLNKAVKNTMVFLGLALPEAVKLATLNPAKVLKIDKRKGSIVCGKDADLVILDKAFNVKLTMVEGTVVYSKLSLRGATRRSNRKP